MIHQYHPKENKDLKTIIWDYGTGSQEREKEKQKGYRRSAHLPIHSMYKKKRKGTRVSTPKTKVPIYIIYNIYRKNQI